MLLCIEMSIFAVMHIFAFPWRPYSIKHAEAHTTTDTKYKGGPLGIVALGEAFNPWDIIKMTARGFRWLFVGVRHRHHDASYIPRKGNEDSMGWDGSVPTSAAGPSTMELQGRGRSETVSTVDDHAGLLANQRVPSESPYRTSTQHSRTTAEQAPPLPGNVDGQDFGAPSRFEYDTAYRPGFSAPSHSANPDDLPHKPGLSGHRQDGQGWDVFGGAAGPPPLDTADVGRTQPSYRFHESGRPM